MTGSCVPSWLAGPEAHPTGDPAEDVLPGTAVARAADEHVCGRAQRAAPSTGSGGGPFDGLGGWAVRGAGPSTGSGSGRSGCGPFDGLRGRALRQAQGAGSSGGGPFDGLRERDRSRTGESSH
jgi:hypothetical protein